MSAVNIRVTNLAHAAMPIVGSFQQFAVTSTATLLYGLAANTQSNKAQIVSVLCEVYSLRWTSDGTAPTATTGFLLAAGVPLLVSAGEASTMQLIAVSAGAATVQIQEYKI
jgi:multisubunit Na+/H+ antiporter MnhB subunit